MNQGYRTIFWGIFLMTFHITIGPIPILPPFVGLYLIYRGIDSILVSFECEELVKAKRYAVLTAVISIAGFIGDLCYFNRPDKIHYAFVLIAVFCIGELLLFYYLLTGSAKRLQGFGFEEMAASFVNRIKTYILIFSLDTALGIVASAFILQTLIGVAAVIGIVIRVGLLVLVSALRNQFPDHPQPERETAVEGQSDQESEIV